MAPTPRKSMNGGGMVSKWVATLFSDDEGSVAEAWDVDAVESGKLYGLW